MRSARGPFAAAFEEHRRSLWDLCYRMTGIAADADDLVQETFARAVESPPPRLDAPLRPWLFRVALNLAKDHLRRRKRQPYVGPWLPSPIETGDAAEPEAPTPSPEARYGLLESATVAFLLALEALTPQQRAVLLLRDVFDYPLKETARVLGISEGAVAAAHHRARAALAAYERARCVPTRPIQERTRRVMEEFFGALGAGDLPALEALLSEDVRSFSDSGGEFLAARNPLHGRDRVARYILGINQKHPPGGTYDVRILNGFPAIVVRLPDGLGPKVARCFVGTFGVDPATGLIREFHIVLAPRKLTAIAFPAP